MTTYGQIDKKILIDKNNKFCPLKRNYIELDKIIGRRC
jgi:hypothetical protein